MNSVGGRIHELSRKPFSDLKVDCAVEAMKGMLFTLPHLNKSRRVPF